MVDEAQYMNIVPRALRDVAVLAEPLTIGTKALSETMKIMQRLPWFNPTDLRRPGDRTYRALVLGTGAVGLLGAMALRTIGFETYVYGRTPAPNPKSAVVEVIGATYVSADDVSARVAQLAGSVDIVFEAVGASPVAFRAMQMLGPNSIFVFTGVPALKATNDVDTDLIMRNAVLKNQVILGTVNAGKADFQAAIHMLGSFNQRWPAAVNALITGRYPLDSYRDLLLGHAAGIKNVLTFDSTRASDRQTQALSAML